MGAFGAILRCRQPLIRNTDRVGDFYGWGAAGCLPKRDCGETSPVYFGEHITPSLWPVTGEH